MSNKTFCGECGDECEAVEETFDYAATHCTHGNSGTHHTGHLISSCCLVDLIDESELIEWRKNGYENLDNI